MRKIINHSREDNLQTRYLMLASMSNKLQKSLEHMKHANEIHMYLEELYSMQTHYECYNTSKKLFRYGLKMISLIEKLRKLDVIIDNDLYSDLILQSLLSSFGQFVMNFNMSKVDVTINELVDMLITVKSTMKKEKTVLIALISKAHNGKTRKKKKKSSSSKGKRVPKEIGYWKRNCKKNLASLKNAMFFVKVNLLINNNIWVFDTAYGSYPYKSLQGI
ncbi:hypothetical protein CDL12_02644 [Handroanthus impetiginosus]|uniref:Uncharacterized protein n=1 Tax=Handroanthus impetiginosus TaxID=429701 RepID=A0A2G9I4E8_9LAMI|nr:hypothetical protein CDL12_02644 [Handroanthus impetiginosus]